MNPDTFSTRHPQETELKLALPGADPAGLARRIARAGILARRAPVRLQLHNVYFDTPDQLLRQQDAALRLRRIGDPLAPRWVQTLKTGGRGGSALTRRNEWESAVDGAELDPRALDAAAWSRVDPKGAVFASLGPCFETTFDRTVWMVRRRDRSLVEVALDIGHVAAGDRRAPICELELELKSGPVSALFDVALQIAASVPVLPLGMSKAQRGYALALDAVDAPVLAQPPALADKLPRHEAARRVLQEMFGQFTANLNAVGRSDDPELVHQARIAWRRFRTARRLFRSVLATAPMPPWRSLQPMLAFLGELRDLDVARTETLPPLRDAYVAGSPRRERAWDAMAQSLLRATGEQRRAVSLALQDPAVGTCLLEATRWLETSIGPAQSGAAPLEPGASLRRWARRRTTRLYAQLKLARRDTSSAELEHRLRIVAKRMRYAVETLHDLLPRRMARDWYRAALREQKRIGATRDLDQALVLLGRMDADPGLVEFLRGLAAGRRTR